MNGRRSTTAAAMISPPFPRQTVRRDGFAGDGRRARSA
jgi:hypothetical protein